MKKLLLSSAAFLSLLSVVSAADLSPGTTAPASGRIVLPFSWTGFYAGVQGGYTWKGTEASLTSDPTGAGGAGAIPTAVDLEDDGFLFGGQVGGNLQLGTFVIGLEADLAWTGLDRTVTRDTAAVGGFPANALTVQSSMDYLGTVRGRAGVAFDRLLVFGTGGLAFGEIEHLGTLTPAAATPALPASTGRYHAHSSFGWAAGLGAEWAFADTMSVKVEYLHYDLGESEMALRSAAGATTSLYTFSNEGDLLRGGLNVRF